MAESTLSLDYDDLAKEVGGYLGYRRSSNNWTADQVELISSIVQSGYRQFLHPPPLPGERHRHSWTFLRPIATLEVESGTEDYDMDPNFGGLDGMLTFATDSQRFSISLVSEAMIRDMRQSGVVNSTPQMAAVQPQSSDGTGGQRFKLLLWPKPDQDYTVSYRYFVNPDRLVTNEGSTSVSFPLGGMPHSETMLESCLSIAEQRANDEKGLHWEKFLERLAASVMHDRQAHSARTLGYNGDPSVFGRPLNTQDYRNAYGIGDVTFSDGFHS